MKNEISEIQTEIENETAAAAALSKIMYLLYVASYGSEETDTTLEMLREAFWQIYKISEEHSQKLESLVEKILEINYSSSNAPV